MKPFHTIAVPHKDILEGRLTMDVFAADLWQVFQKTGPDEYKDAQTFFNKTYVTQGLDNLLGIVEKRITGKGGDPVIQIQTPFGGGKTHALIAMYHMAEKWGANKVVIVGTEHSPEDTLWGLMEKQLTGSISQFSGKVAPGRGAIRDLLQASKPLLILIDELLEYITKAAGVKVEGSTLAAQSIAFIQELTETISTLENICLVITLPASIMEHYDEEAERFFQQLQKVSGRVEKIYTPVMENEIAKIIRQRLFGKFDESEASKLVNEFMKYAEKEEIVPVGMEPSEYRDRFLDSYPFMSEVVDILYHRWGSFPTFQRTRGVLRLLSLVIYSLHKTNLSYISLANFDLANQEIRQELLKHIGPEFNSVIASDISDHDAGSKKVDVSLGGAYKGLGLGSRTATSIFMHSFSGGQEKGTTLNEIKRCATTTGNPSSVVSEAVEQLKNKLFYLQTSGDRYFFSNQPNINRILLTKMENISEEEVRDTENELLKANISKTSPFKVYIWEENPANITDSEELKLVILRKGDNERIKQIIENKGQTPRVNRNTMIFVYPLESEKSALITNITRKLAYGNILKDKNLRVTADQKKEIEDNLKKINSIINELIRRTYRMIAIPSRDGFKEDNLGIPTYGEYRSLDIEAYDKLRSDGEILESIAPIVIKEKFLKDKEYVSTEQLYQSFLKTPGETRLTSKNALEKGIYEGVQKGIFGLGELEDDKPKCHYFDEHVTISFSTNEIIICEGICREQKEEVITIVPPEHEPEPEHKGVKGGKGTVKEPEIPSMTKIHVRFKVPEGKVASLIGVLNLLKSKFETLEIELKGTEGSMTYQEFDDKIQEAFDQLGIELEVF